MGVFRGGRALGHATLLVREKWKLTTKALFYDSFVILGGHGPGCSQSRTKFTEIGLIRLQSTLWTLSDYVETICLVNLFKNDHEKAEYLLKTNCPTVPFPARPLPVLHKLACCDITKTFSKHGNGPKLWNLILLFTPFFLCNFTTIVNNKCNSTSFVWNK